MLTRSVSRFVLPLSLVLGTPLLGCRSGRAGFVGRFVRPLPCRLFVGSCRPFVGGEALKMPRGQKGKHRAGYQQKANGGGQRNQPTIVENRSDHGDIEQMAGA